MKTLNVVKVNAQEIREHWGSCFGFSGVEYFIRCNRKAEINWDKAPVYTWPEIQIEQQKRRVCFLVPKEVFEL